jgi:hypothetical protein
MNTLVPPSTIVLVATSLLSASLLAGDPPKQRSTSSQEEERLVFLTGSHIPQRVKVRRVGTKTVSPVRAIDRSEIDYTGHPTTTSAVANDPSVNVIGH